MAVDFSSMGSPQHYQIHWSEICVRFPSRGAVILFQLLVFFLFRKVSSFFLVVVAAVFYLVYIVVGDGDRYGGLESS